MTAKFHTEGRQWAFEVLFTDQQAIPANFYVGMVTDADLAENASLADINELANNSGDDLGYIRFAVASSVAGWTSAAAGTNDRKVTSITVSFTAESGWSNAKTWFLATTIDNTGKLLFSGVVNGGSGYALTIGQTYSFEIELTWPET